MSFRDKRAHITSEEVIKWILYIAILIAAGFSVYKIAGKFI